MKMRKVVSILLVAAMTIGMVTGCGSSSDKKTAKSDAKGKVYYLNFKPKMSNGRNLQSNTQMKQEFR